MKNLNKLIVPVLIVLLITSCQNTNKDVVDLNDIKPYLKKQPDQSLTSIRKNFAFWEQKLKTTPSQFTYNGQLANLENQLFSKTGTIGHLKNAEKLLLEAIEKSGYKQTGYLRSLAKNYISQHQFKQALFLLEKAKENGDKKQETIKMLFDVHHELGNEEKAEHFLQEIKNKRSFDYLIRLAKWQDYKGNLDATIAYMEEALAIVQAKEYQGLELWCLTNLADYYGHHGDIQKSYEYYLKALEKNPHNYYALKKIAWISFSNDKDVSEVKTILSYLNKEYNGLDVDLLAYEISVFENKETEKKHQIYWSQVQNPAYGDMYNKYNFDILMSRKEYNKAYKIAQQEVENRPTAVSYSMLALASAYTKQPEKGLEIVTKHKVLKSYEPEVLLRVAKLYAINKKQQELKPIKKELEGAAFELGPVKMIEIQKL